MKDSLKGLSLISKNYYIQIDSKGIVIKNKNNEIIRLTGGQGIITIEPLKEFNF